MVSWIQSGAVEAWRAHNPQVPGSKPGSERLFLFCCSDIWDKSRHMSVWSEAKLNIGHCTFLDAICQALHFHALASPLHLGTLVPNLRATPTNIWERFQTTLPLSCATAAEVADLPNAPKLRHFAIFSHRLSSRGWYLRRWRFADTICTKSLYCMGHFSPPKMKISLYKYFNNLLYDIGNRSRVIRS